MNATGVVIQGFRPIDEALPPGEAHLTAAPTGKRENCVEEHTAKLILIGFHIGSPSCAPGDAYYYHTFPEASIL